MKLESLGLSLSLFAAAVALSPASAGPLTVEQLAAEADLVVRGTVVAQDCQRDPSRRIYTRIRLQVSEVWKGTLADGLLTIVHSGGVVGRERLVVSHQVKFEVGEEVVLFLVLNQSGEGVCVGMAQGKYCVEKDVASGKEYAWRHLEARPGIADRTAASAAPGERVELVEFKRRVWGGGR